MGEGAGRGKYAGFMENAAKNKSGFVQLFLMTGVLMLSMRSLGQKYRIHDLREDISALEREGTSLSHRMSALRESLLHEGSLHPSSSPLSSAIRALFPDSTPQ